MKMLVVFAKRWSLRFIGHLDLQRAMQRALRRSRLPVRFSRGFNPHIMLSFAAPLSVGLYGQREIMEVPLESPVDEGIFLIRLNRALPDTLRCVMARLLDDDHPSAMARLYAAQYEIQPVEPCPRLLAAVPGFLARESIPFIRKTKSGEKPADLRPLIHNLIVRDGELLATLALSEAGTAKPEALIQELSRFAGIEPPRCRVGRLALLSDRFSPLEDL